MPVDREAIMDALLSRLRDGLNATEIGLRTATRRNAGFDVSVMPALLLVTDSMERDELGKWTIRAQASLFLPFPANEKNPESRLNAAVDAIDAALTVAPAEMPTFGNGPTTLGGLCTSAGISGERIEMYQHLEGAAQVDVPLEIIVYEKD